MKAALIGYGLGGAVFHAPLIASTPGLELAAIVTGNPERQEQAGREHPGADIVPHVDRLWEMPERYDLVVIAAPNRQHVPLARAALEADLPVVVDKPVAASVSQARALASLAAKRAQPIVPFHNRRWDGDALTVRRLVDEGELGRVLRLESRFVRWRPVLTPGWKDTADPADAVGVLFDLGSHLVDQVITLFGRPTQVFAELDVRRPGAKAVDDAFVALTHPGGVRSHLWMSAVAADLGPRFRVLGDRAAYVKYGMDVQEEQLRAGLTPADEGFGADTPGSYGRLGTPESGAVIPTDAGRYQEFYARLVEALRGEGPVPVPIGDAIAGLEVIEAAQRSAAEGAVVHLPPAESAAGS